MAGAFRQIMYVGPKARKTDTLFNSGLVWEGKGDVIDVPEPIARHLIAHPTVWQDVTGKYQGRGMGPPEVVPAGVGKNVTFPGGVQEQIVAAVQTLDPDNPKHFTNGGKPQLGILRDILGTKVTANDRDIAWSSIEEARKAELGQPAAEQ